MSCETNLLKENNELNEQVKKLSNKLERCYNSKATFKRMLSNQRSYGDKSGLGFKTSKVNTQRSQDDTSGISFNNSKIKGKRWGKRRYEREMKKQEQERLSHFMCFKYHEVGHLANGCPNQEKLKLKKEAQACQVLQVPHLGLSHLNMPNQAIGEATSEASTKAPNTRQDLP
jgi:hypothetical protein